MMAWCDGEIAQALLGQTASMDSQGGLNSQENPGLGVRSDIAAADDAKLCETLYTQALREYCEYAYGDPDLAPRPKYQTQPPEDELKARQGDFAVSQALVNFATAKAPINVRQYLEELAYPLLTVEEEAKLKADAQAQEQEQSDQEHSKAMQLMAAKKDSPVVDKGQSTDGKSINDTGTSKKEK